MLLQSYLFICFFFFFQAEDGIRDIGVTGVQTCALPILLRVVTTCPTVALSVSRGAGAAVTVTRSETCPGSSVMFNSSACWTWRVIGPCSNVLKPCSAAENLYCEGGRAGKR